MQEVLLGARPCAGCIGTFTLRMAFEVSTVSIPFADEEIGRTGKSGEQAPVTWLVKVDRLLFSQALNHCARVTLYTSRTDVKVF